MTVSAESYDAIVVGSGPNGLAAAITLAEAGRSVCVFEAAATPGGGARSAALIEPGAIHDVCSAVHPLAVASPFFRRQPLTGLGFAQPEIPFAHPLDGRPAAVVFRDLHRTAERLGRDEARYTRLLAPLVRRAPDILDDALRPVLHLPRHPLAFARFGLPALLPMTTLAKLFHDDEAIAILSGCAAHSLRPLTTPLTASFGLMLLAVAHASGWPFVVGGTQRITDALVARLDDLGGAIVCERPVRALSDLPPSRAVLFDVAPRQLASIAADALPQRYRRALERYRPGPGVCKVDYLLSEPVPWTDGDCRRAGTVHVGGTLAEIAAAERDVNRGRVPERPFTLVAQPSLFDATRAGAGRHVLWAYCHVPNGCPDDVTPLIEAQIERFAPGFRDVVVARHTMTSVDYERYNSSFLGGDIANGAHSVRQLVFRPTARRAYTTPNPALFLCSAATPPGAGVHGMCGEQAARAALATVLR